MIPTLVLNYEPKGEAIFTLEFGIKDEFVFNFAKREVGDKVKGALENIKAMAAILCLQRRRRCRLTSIARVEVRSAPFCRRKLR